jgi:hypothetical protein
MSYSGTNHVTSDTDSDEASIDSDNTPYIIHLVIFFGIYTEKMEALSRREEEEVMESAKKMALKACDDLVKSTIQLSHRCRELTL